MWWCGVDSFEHLLFGFWLKEKFTDEGSQDYQEELQSLKENLPEGIKSAVFEEWVTISTKNPSYTLRSFPNESKFKIIQKKRGSKKMLIQEVGDKNKLYLDENLHLMFAFGSGESFYWKIRPVENATRFEFYNPSRNAFMTSHRLKNNLQDIVQIAKKSSDFLNDDTEKWIISTKYNLGTPSSTD